MILQVDGMHAYYGASHILFGISFQVDEGEVVGLLGRNGAGKTTTLRSVMGLTPPRSGSVKFRGKEISRKSPVSIARMGMGFVDEARRISPDLTVRQNLEVASKVTDGFQEWTVERVHDLFPVLKELDSRRGGLLSGGQQQMLGSSEISVGNRRIFEAS
jgi:branched-chain amino acid transport system ATP-binding protein